MRRLRKIRGRIDHNDRNVYKCLSASFFDWLIETSIMASILVVLILCIKVLFRNKLTPRWQYMLWIILIIRLVLPWSPDSSYSIYSVLTYKNDDAFISSRNPVAIFLSKRTHARIERYRRYKGSHKRRYLYLKFNTN